MTEREWDTVCLLLGECWPGVFDDARQDAWRVMLDDYEALTVLVALKALAARGGSFRPSLGEVVAQIRLDPSVPVFTEAYRLIYGPGGILRARPEYKPGGWREDELRKESDRLALELADRCHPLLGAFVRAQGLRRLRMLEVDHPEFGNVRRKELAADWDAFREAHEGREIAALVEGRRGEIARFDPLHALGASGGRPALTAITGGAAAGEEA